MKNVLVFGTFDHLHKGHRYLLDQASRLGQLHIVVARDVTVEHVKGHGPDQTELERLQALEEAYPEAMIRLGDEENYSAPLNDIDPDCVVLGYDQRLPGSLSAADIRCEVIRMDAFYPEKYKSSLMRKNK